MGSIEKKYNVDIKLILATYDSCITLYGNSQADAVCITNIDILGAAGSRNSVGILPTSTSAGADACIVAGINTLEELAGKPTRGLEKSVSQYCFERCLEKLGTNPADYPFSQMDPEQAALAFLSSNVMVTPAWLQPASIVQRIGPSTVVSSRQAGLVASLLSPARLGRLAESETYDASNAYPLMEYMAELKRSVFTNGTPDAGRRQLHRVYLQRLDALLSPPAPPAAAGGGGGGGGGGGAARFVPFVSAPNVVQSDLPALARAQDSLQPLPSLNVPGYMGTWYQVAWFPNRFQKQCVSDTSATYRQQPDGRIEVLNRCRKADGSFDEALGQARPVGTLTGTRLAPAQLQVSFLPGWLRWLPVGWGRYWVIQLADDGRYAVISEPTREYLWVLSRRPELSPADETAIRSALARQGFGDLSAWQPHPHTAR